MTGYFTALTISGNILYQLFFTIRESREEPLLFLQDMGRLIVTIEFLRAPDDSRSPQDLLSSQRSPIQ